MTIKNVNVGLVIAIGLFIFSIFSLLFGADLGVTFSVTANRWLIMLLALAIILGK